MSRWELEFTIRQSAFQLELGCRSDARVLGLFGPSGCGKTTAVESVAGLRRKACGRIACDGFVMLDSERDLKLKTEQRHIGYLPQQALLFPHLSARENLEFGRRRDSGNVIATEEVVEILELGDFLDQRTQQLSGGQAQRVALGRALCSGPKMLLLDEPMAALDGALRQRILPFLLRVLDRFRLPMLVVSHSAYELQVLCDDVIQLENGRVAGQGRPEVIFAKSGVYEVVAKEGFENVLPARIEKVASTNCQLRLGGEGLSLTASPTRLPVGAQVKVGLPAADIVVSLRAVEGLSARNRLPARVLRVEPTDQFVLLIVRVGSELPELAVELTRDAVEELGIRPGCDLFLIIKSSSVSILG